MERQVTVLQVISLVHYAIVAVRGWAANSIDARVRLTLGKMRAEANAIIAWYNTCHPHTALGGRTPDERYRRVASACQRPRWEPRPLRPNHSPAPLRN
jgi:hypothetical protein